jgi:hypothetical protein
MVGDVTGRVGELTSNLNKLNAETALKKSRLDELDRITADLLKNNYRGNNRFDSASSGMAFQKAYNEAGQLRPEVFGLGQQQVALQQELNPWNAQLSQIMKYLNG